jgi:hypothetical protein
MDVKVEGENVVRNLDMTTHNHASTPANGAAPMVHTAAVALGKVKACASEAQEIEKKCTGEPKPDPCPAILGVPIKAGSESGVGKIKASFKARGLSAAAMKEVKPQVKLARASTTVAEKSDKAACTRAMRCLLRPYGEEKDGVKGCCPGQTPHHIPPWSTTKSVSGNNVKHDNALCICLEGAGHSIGSHGKHHHGINFTLQQMSSTPGTGVVKSTNSSGHTIFSAPLKQHVAASAAVTEAQNGCSKECIEEQLNKQYGDEALKKSATHNASTTGGTEHRLMDPDAQSRSVAALRRPPRIS